MDEPASGDPLFLNPYESLDIHRRRLPHWDQEASTQFVTWRLWDSIPAELLEFWGREKEVWLGRHPRPWDADTEKEYDSIFGQRVDGWLDAGHGSCFLRDTETRRIVEEALRFFEGERYDFWAFVIMPNHVHTLFSPFPKQLLERTLHSWKGFTAKEINFLLGRSGSVWSPDYHDRMIRDEAHFDSCVRYIRRNPMKAGLGSSEYTLFVKEGL